MKLRQPFGSRVQICISEISDGNMATTANPNDQPKLAKSLNLGPSQTLLVRCPYTRDTFTTYLFNPNPKTHNITDNTNISSSDGILTDREDVALLLPLADCLGVVLYDATKNLLMLVHSGRHNLEQNGLASAVQFMIDHGATPKNIQAYLSPAALDYPIHKLDNQKLLDVALHQLTTSAINPKNITSENINTATHPHYPSHSQGDTTTRFAIAARIIDTFA